MSGYKVFSLLVVCLAVSANGMPQDKSDQNSFLGLPFLQLTNGGIRVNFAGYHAEAGLGGLLGRSSTGGGLHASAGTPWGAHAAAGLGGALGGEDATAGGGLYARAGLGNGRPEAAAGLGGMLDGSGRSNVPAAGGLFAGATTGVRTSGVAATNHGTGASASAGSDANTDTGETAKSTKAGAGRTSIQIVSRSRKDSEKSKQGAQLVEVNTNTHGTSGRNEETHLQEQQSAFVPAAGASLVGAIYVEPQRSTVYKSIEKTKVLGGPVRIIAETPRAPPAPPLHVEYQYSANANAVVEGDAPKNIVYHRVVHPRRFFRKGFWAREQKKQVLYVPAEEVGVQADSTSGNTRRMSTRASGDAAVDVNAQRTAEAQNTNDGGDTFFDDVFNIPISTLTAVNQLLRNNAG